MNNSTSSTHEIQASKNQTALIDIQFQQLSIYSWHSRFQKKYAGTRYLIARTDRSSGVRKTVYLHREIMELHLGRPLLSSEWVDHISGDTLDNRVCNLRLANRSENARNMKAHADNKSGYKGVSWSKKEKRWVAQITVYGETKRIGAYHTPEDAYAAYCTAAIDMHGDFVNLG
jgi:hypothetical protein